MQEDARCTPCPSMGNVTVGCTSTELRVPPGYMVRALGCSTDPSAQLLSRCSVRCRSSRRGGLRSRRGHQSLRLVSVPQRDGPLHLYVRTSLRRFASPGDAVLQEQRLAQACRGGHFNASSVPGERAQDRVEGGWIWRL